MLAAILLTLIPLATPPEPGDVLLVLPDGQHALIRTPSTAAPAVQSHGGGSYTVRIGGSQPEPGPGPPVPPVPPTPPAPQPPDPDLGQYKLPRLVYDAAMQVQDPARADKCHRLAKGLRSVNAAIVAGGLKGTLKIIAATREQISAVVADSDAGWTPLRTAVNDAIVRLYKEKVLRTDAQFAVALSEIAVGLEAVR